MCGIFGFLNYKDNLSQKELTSLVNTLACASEERGSHATGIAFIKENKLQINKAPMPAHKINYQLTAGINVVMGHTRHATQGSQHKNNNNHPFSGKLKNKKNFALAHNGVLWNDSYLRKSLTLPKTKIETDSYIAVQLLESQGRLDELSLKYMAEKVEGSFTFSVLDNKGNLYFVKGDSPLSIVHFVDLGIYVYASTDEILYRALAETSLLKSIKKSLSGKGVVTPIDVTEGQIITITSKGEMNTSTFKFDPYAGYGYSWWDFNMFSEQKAADYEDPYVQELLQTASFQKINEADVFLLLDYGFESTEIEGLLYDRQLFNSVVDEVKADLLEYCDDDQLVF